jgi:hypothetical protein
MRNRIDGLLAECAVETEQFIQYFKPLGRGTLRVSKDPAQRPAVTNPPAPAAVGKVQT